MTPSHRNGWVPLNAQRASGTLSRDFLTGRSRSHDALATISVSLPAFAESFTMRSLSIAVFMFAGVVPLAAQDDPRRPPAITAEGVPPVDAALAQRLRQYQSMRSTRFRGWAPDGRGLLVQTQFANTAQLHLVEQPGGMRRQLTFEEEPTDGSFLPQRSDGTLLLESARGGNENYQFTRKVGPYGPLELWTDGTSRHLLGAIHSSGDSAIIASNRRNGRDMDLFLVSLTERKEWTELLQVDNQSWNVQDWSDDRQTLLLARYVSINETQPAMFDIATRKLTPLALLPQGRQPAAYGRMRFAKDGRSFYFTSDALGEFQQLYLYDRATGAATQQTPWKTWNADVEELTVDPVTGRLVCVLNERGFSRAWLIDANTSTPLELPRGILDRVEFSPDGKRLGFTLARPNRPADVFSWDVAAKHLDQWTFSETGGLDPARFTGPEPFEYPTFDGRAIPAFLTRPPETNGQKLPVLIQIHGGPESQYRPGFSPIDQFWTGELGIAVIAPNVRGSAGYGQSYLKLDNGPLREDSVRDIGALLDWIAKQPDLDASRVAVTGGSYGGYMVLASLTHFPDRIRAGVDVVGIANFITFLERTSAYRRDLRRAEYGDERDPAMRAVFERINPTANAGKIRSALLVAHGKNDPRVPFFEAELIAPLVRKNNVPVWTVYADNEGHGFGKRENRDYLTLTTARFLQEFLLKP